MSGTIAVVLVAAAIACLGLLGAYGYGRDYYVHRGFPTLLQLPRAGSGRLVGVNFYSGALHRQAGYLVYLPPGYSPHRRYPVYYLLHGMPGQPKVFVDIANMDVRLDNQISLGRTRPMILVYPDGRIGGSVFSDSEWANTPSGSFESYVIEVVHNVDRRFSTLSLPRGRVIAGFSAGAYGAMNIALHHLGVFANVQSWSGYFTQSRNGVFASASPATLVFNSPLDYVKQLRASLAVHPLRVYMFVGRDDPASRQLRAMVSSLRAEGVQVTSRLYSGGHDWSVWYPRLNQMLDLASWDAAHPVRAAVSAGGTARRYLRSEGARSPVLAPGTHTGGGIRLRPAGRGRRSSSEALLLGALMLALISGALINLGFVLQQRGHSRASDLGRTSLIAGFREPCWLIGQVFGWLGFLGLIGSVALAPLTLVQAFGAGSLALSVPLAALVVGQRVRRDQLVAIGIIAISLASLPIGFAPGHGQLHAGLLIAAAMAALLVGVRLAPGAGSVASASTAGALYGVADAAIKADALALHARGFGSLLSGWTVLAGLCTFAGFLRFQAALRDGDAIRPLSVMNAFTAVVAASLGVIAFGESTGNGLGASIAHGTAIALVLACVRPLARAQHRFAYVPTSAGSAQTASDSSPPAGIRHDTPKLSRRNLTFDQVPRALWRAGLSAVAGLAVVTFALTAVGLLYYERGLHWLAIGPSVPDALPLLQLAGFSSQPLLPVLAAGLAAGVALGVTLAWLSRWRRLMFVGIFGSLLMIVASDASYAVARNLGLNWVLVNHTPGFGAWLEGLLLAASCVAVPHRTRAELRTLTSALRVRQAAPLQSGPIPARRRLALIPVVAAGLTAALLAALDLPSGHVRAQARSAISQGSQRSAEPVSAWARAPQPWRGRARLAPAVAPSAGHLVTVNFYSEALRRRADYLIYLPREYTPNRRLPVFYMLHGMPGRPLAFTVDARVEPKLEALVRWHRVQPMILVFPDGRIGGRTATDSEWANTPAGRFQSYVADVVRNVDHRFATRPHRQDRAIAGLSAGAYGAANVGLHLVADFGLIQVWSGYFTQTRTGVFAHATRVQLAHNSPADYVYAMRRELERYPLDAFIYVGRDERDRPQTPSMTAALRAEGADAHYAVYPGGHSWKLWSPRIDQMLIMASRYFAAGRLSSPRHPVRRRGVGRSRSA